MIEPLIDVVAVPDHAGAPRWQAVARLGTVAGVAGLRPPMVPGAAELSLYVQPGWRRRGIGTRLLTTVREGTAKRHLFAAVAPGSPGEAFCRWHGFRHTRSGRYDLLTYCDVHQAWLGELIDAEHPGYRLSHWTGDLPRAPDVEELLRGPSRSGDAVLTAAAADGALAAYALAVVGAPPEPRARQYGPAVLPGHRGRGLGLWVNAGLIQRLREVHPQVGEIGAATAEDDPGLLVTRRQLGFRPVRRTRLYQLDLS